MKILAFAATNSSVSINKKLIEYTCSLLDQHEVNLLDMNDFEVPIFGIDVEKEQGFPDEILVLARYIDETDLIIISFAEHNGAYATIFKNVFDWLSRIPNRKTWAEKDMYLMATSPGPRGGAGVLQIAVSRFPFNGGIVKGHFSLPNFRDNFIEGAGIVNEEIKSNFLDFVDMINNN